MSLANFQIYSVAGNRFFICETLSEEERQQIPAICQRHKVDQVLEVTSLDPLSFTIINTDGWVAEMCGNGACAVMQWNFDQCGARPSLQAPETVAISGQNYKYFWRADQAQPTLRLPLPRVGEFESLLLDNRKIWFVPVNVSNPHIVVVCESAEAIAADYPSAVYQQDREFLLARGKSLEHHEYFSPERTNVQLVVIKRHGQIKVTPFERSVGFTRACGSGAVAASAVCRKFFDLEAKNYLVEMPGGEIDVRYAFDSVDLSASVIRST